MKEVLRARFGLLLAWLRARATSPSDLVFPDRAGRMFPKRTQLELGLRRAMRKANLGAGYVHKCRRKGSGYQEPTADQNPRRCPKCKLKLSAIGQVRPIRFHHLPSCARTLTRPLTPPPDGSS